MWAVIVVCAVGFAVCVWTDPRRLRAGLWLLTGLSAAVLAASSGLLARLTRDNTDRAAWVLAGVAGLVVLVVLALAVALIVNGVVVLRREGHRLANLLGGVVGIGMLGYLVAYVLVLAANSARAFLWLLALAGPVGYLAYGFSAFVLYAGVYQAVTKRWRRPAGVVIVLGAGLVRGRVSRLLASRLETGRTVYDRAVAAGGSPLVVVSGGQGSDEPRPEADAMAEYLVEHGVPEDAILRETASTTTRENLRLSAAVLATRDPALVERGRGAGVVVVTSNFHAFRAATLMRALRLPGRAVGAPAAWYYWPSATIREYVALLRDHPMIALVGIGLACLPLLAMVAFTLEGMRA